MVPFSQSVAVGTNEIVTRFSLNRNFEKLLSNDVYLSELRSSSIRGMDIQEYQPQGLYNYGDTVWFNPHSGDDTQRYLLKCVIDGNQNNPSLAVSETSSYVNGEPYFMKYGWYNQNQSIPLSSSSLGITNRVSLEVGDGFSSHEESHEMHRFGELVTDQQSESFHDRKVMASDVSNAAYPRSRIFYPYESGRFTTDSILNGVYRKWDNGFMEMDLVYRLGFAGTRDAGGYMVDVISCNTLVARAQTGDDSTFDRTNNMDYFRSVGDMDIFRGEYSGVSKVGNTWQTNRNDHVNVYSARLDFSQALPTGFADSNYMVFSSDHMSQRRILGRDSMNPGTNTITFCDRSRRSITAVYVTTPGLSALDSPSGEVASHCCICSNVFSCRIIGRWR